MSILDALYCSTIIHSDSPEAVVRDVLRNSEVLYFNGVQLEKTLSKKFGAAFYETHDQSKVIDFAWNTLLAADPGLSEVNKHLWKEFLNRYTHQEGIIPLLSNVICMRAFQLKGEELKSKILLLQPDWAVSLNFCQNYLELKETVQFNTFAQDNSIRKVKADLNHPFIQAELVLRIKLSATGEPHINIRRLDISCKNQKFATLVGERSDLWKRIVDFLRNLFGYYPEPLPIGFEDSTLNISKRTSESENSNFCPENTPPLRPSR